MMKVSDVHADDDDNNDDGWLSSQIYTILIFVVCLRGVDQ